MKRRFKDLSAAEVLALADIAGRGRRTAVAGVRPAAAAELPQGGRIARLDAQGRGLASAPAGRAVSAKVRRRDSAFAAAGRARLCAPRPAAIGAPLGRAADSPAGGSDGTGDAAVLHPGGRSRRAMPNCDNSWAIWPRRNGGTRCSPASSIRPISRRTSKQDEAETARQLFVLQIIQPGLVGLDGRLRVDLGAACSPRRSPRTKTWPTFLVGLAASVGAGISMGFAEALSDDGSLTGRGHPYLRGLICGLMTLWAASSTPCPILIPHFWVATAWPWRSSSVELFAIAWIRNRYMDSPFATSVFPGGGGRRWSSVCGDPHRQFAVSGTKRGQAPSPRAIFAGQT